MKINLVIGNGKFDDKWSLDYLGGKRLFEFMDQRFRFELEIAIFEAMNRFVQNALRFESCVKGPDRGQFTSCDLNDLQLVTHNSVEAFLDYEVRETGLTKSSIRDLLACNALVSKQDIARFFLTKVYPNINVVIKPPEN